MRVVADVHLGDIVVMDKLPLNPKTLELVSKISQGYMIPPLHVRPVVGRKGKFVLLRGKYEYLACKLMGMRTVTVRYSPKHLFRKVH